MYPSQQEVRVAAGQGLAKQHKMTASVVQDLPNQEEVPAVAVQEVLPLLS